MGLLLPTGTATLAVTAAVTTTTAAAEASVGEPSMSPLVSASTPLFVNA